MEIAALAQHLALGDLLETLRRVGGGVKEILRLAEIPHRGGLWHSRCPDNPEFEGPAPQVLDRVVTVHWFDPCELLVDDARSELKPEHRERQAGGGWVCRNPKV